MAKHGPGLPLMPSSKKYVHYITEHERERE